MIKHEKAHIRELLHFLKVRYLMGSLDKFVVGFPLGFIVGCAWWWFVTS